MNKIVITQGGKSAVPVGRVRKWMVERTPLGEGLLTAIQEYAIFPVHVKVAAPGGSAPPVNIVPIGDVVAVCRSEKAAREALAAVVEALSREEELIRVDEVCAPWLAERGQG